MAYLPEAEKPATHVVEQEQKKKKKKKEREKIKD